MSPDGVKPKFPNRLSEYLSASGIRPSELARRIGKPRQSIHNLLRGNIRLTKEYAELIAPILGVTAAALLGLGSRAAPELPLPVQRMIALRRTLPGTPAEVAAILGVPASLLTSQESGREPLDPAYVLALLRATKTLPAWIDEGDPSALPAARLILIHSDAPELVPLGGE